MALKRRRNPSLVPRSLQLMAALGYQLVDRCEAYVPFGGGVGVRRDLFGLADIIGVSVGEGILFVQVCSRKAVSSHIRKIHESALENLQILLSVADFEIWGWDQPNGVGSRWRCSRWVPVFHEGQLCFNAKGRLKFEMKE